MTDITIAFDTARPTRRSAAATQCGYSVIEDDGSIVTGQGKTYGFTVSRLFDKRAAQGERVTWEVELYQGNGRRLAAHTLPEARAEILRLFKGRIEQDNAAKDAAGELTPRQAQARGIAKIAQAEQQAQANRDDERPSVTQEQLEAAQRLGGFWLITYHYAIQPEVTRTELVEAQDHAGACGRFHRDFPSPTATIVRAAKIDATLKLPVTEDELEGLEVVRTHAGNYDATVPLNLRRLGLLFHNSVARKDKGNIGHYFESEREVLEALKAGLEVETQTREYRLVQPTQPTPPKADDQQTLDRRNGSLASFAASRNQVQQPAPAAAQRALPLSAERAQEVLDQGSQAGSYRQHLTREEELAVQAYWLDFETPGAWSFGDVIRHCAKQAAPKPFAEPTDEDQEAACRGLEVLRERAEPEDRLNTSPVIAELTWEDCKVISRRNGFLSPHQVLKALVDGSVVYTSISRYVLVRAIQHPSERAQAAIDLALATRAAQEAEEKRKDALAVYRSLNRPIAAEEAPEASPVRSCA